MSKYRINLDGKFYEMEIERIDEIAATSEEAIGAGVHQENSEHLPKPDAQTAAGIAAEGNTGKKNNIVYSPMPGTILKLLAKNGDAVKNGQPVLVLEAMKMENEITAPKDGVVSGLNVGEKQTVQGGTMLFEIVD